jgi:hypothetical protein
MESRSAFWNDHLSRCKNTGASQKEYCRSNNLNYHTFKYWQNKLKKEKVNGAGKGFVEIPVKGLYGNTEIKIMLSNGITISVNPGVNKEIIKQYAESLMEIS